MTPVRLPSSDAQGNLCLVTSYNDLGNGRFADPRSKQSFKYDHLRKEASELQPWNPDSELEGLRSAIEAKVSSYVTNHFKHGVTSTFSVKEDNRKAIVVCIEDHQFQPKNYWNGRWRSIWTVDLSSGANQVQVDGVLKVQVHYYEDGNVQLVTSKNIQDTISVAVSLILFRDVAQIASLFDNYKHY